MWHHLSREIAHCPIFIFVFEGSRPQGHVWVSLGSALDKTHPISLLFIVLWLTSWELLKQLTFQYVNFYSEEKSRIEWSLRTSDLFDEPPPREREQCSLWPGRSFVQWISKRTYKCFDHSNWPFSFGSSRVLMRANQTLPALEYCSIPATNWKSSYFVSPPPEPSWVRTKPRENFLVVRMVRTNSRAKENLS